MNHLKMHGLLKTISFYMEDYRGVTGRSPVRRGSGRPRSGLERGEGFPLLYKNLCSQEEEREENVNAAEEHDDVAEEVHELDFLKVVENDAHEIEGGTEYQHAEAFCRKNFKEVLSNNETREAGYDIENYIQL